MIGSALCFADIASAGEVACADANQAACPSQQTGSPAPDGSSTLRASLDRAKAAVADKLFGVQLSAFGDATSDVNDAGERKFQWGLLELDAAADFGDDLQAALAVVMNRDDTRIGAGFVDFHTFGGRIAPRGRLWVEKGFHVQAGRFDVPFGNDWQFFASKDSVSISRPLSTDAVMDGGYNDSGFRALGNDGTLNFNIYLLRGFNRGRLLGGRLGVTPFSDPFSLKTAQAPKTLELGVSYFYDGTSHWRKNEAGYAIDGELHVDAWTGRFESIVRKREAPVAGQRTTLRAWHLTQEYALGEALSWPTILFARYEVGVVDSADATTPGASNGDERDIRIASGVSSNLFNSNVLQWKFEAQHYLKATRSTRETPGFGGSVRWLMQLVVVL